MMAGNQDQTIYTWDDDNRLTQIQQGTGSPVTFQYDNANRRTVLTLPNGVTVNYGYDFASNLTSLKYQHGATILGNLSYNYDANNRVLQKAGSFAQINMPAVLSSASYDSADQLLQWGDSSFSYDANGNMTSNGQWSYNWDARGQLSEMSNPSASYFNSNVRYDGFGRRMANFNSTNFLYDGWNAVQELSGTTVTANRTTGEVDEFFSRADSTGAYYPLTDLLGSTVALTDANGNLVSTYGYDPYGNTTASGSNNNFFEYTGRELDNVNGSSLYYYRTRYYNPTIDRFISQDPIGFAGGINGYAYALNSPTNFVDPSGTSVSCMWGLICGDGPLSGVSGGGAGFGGMAGTGCHCSDSSGGSQSGAAPNLIECWAMDLVGGNVGCVEGQNGPVVSVNMQDGTTVYMAYGGLNPPGTPLGSPNFVVTENGTAVPIPQGYQGRVADNGNGSVYQDPASVGVGNGNANCVRIADPNKTNPTTYIRIYNDAGQPIDPETGLPGSNADTHIPEGYEGEIVWPE